MLTLGNSFTETWPWGWTTWVLAFKRFKSITIFWHKILRFFFFKGRIPTNIVHLFVQSKSSINLWSINHHLPPIYLPFIHISIIIHLRYWVYVLIKMYHMKFMSCFLWSYFVLNIYQQLKKLQMLFWRSYRDYSALRWQAHAQRTPEPHASLHLRQTHIGQTGWGGNKQGNGRELHAELRLLGVCLGPSLLALKGC